MRLDAVVVAVILGVVRADCAFEVTELAHASCLRIVGGGTITMALVTVASGLPATFLRGLRRNRLRYDNGVIAKPIAQGRKQGIKSGLRFSVLEFQLRFKQRGSIRRGRSTG